MAEIFTRFDPAQDIVANLRQTVSSGMWSGGVGTLATFFTSSTQSSSNGQYYYDLYKTDPASDSEAEVQLSVAFGDRNGSGSLGQTGNFPSKAIYSQYRNLLLTPGDSKFTFGGSVDSDRIYVLTTARARLREKMDPGNWELHLSGSVLRIVEACGYEPLDFLTEVNTWYVLNDGMMCPGIYKIKEAKILNSTGEELVEAKDKIIVEPHCYPKGEMLGLSIYEVKHQKTGQLIYITSSEVIS